MHTNKQLLRSLTRMDINKLFQSRPTQKNSYSYQFLTPNEIKIKFDGSLRRAKYLLQMPPVVQVESDKIRILSKDPALQGLTDSKVVITDITFNLRDNERPILVREPNGDLKTAAPEIRRRMNQIYFPMEGRKVFIPKMFENEHLHRCLDNRYYEFVLNRACIQFEPYEKDYHRVTSITYQHINDHNEFDCLRSTRHFGPFAFFLAWHKLIDNLLIDCIKRDYLRNAVELICLSHNLNETPYDSYTLQHLEHFPEHNDEYWFRKMIEESNNSNHDDEVRLDIENTVGKTADDLKLDNICLTIIDEYVKANASKKNELNVALTTYREESQEKQRLLEGLQKAHGIN